MGSKRKRGKDAAAEDEEEASAPGLELREDEDTQLPVLHGFLSDAAAAM